MVCNIMVCRNCDEVLKLDKANVKAYVLGLRCVLHPALNA